MKQIENTVQELVLEAGEILRDNAFNIGEVEWKKKDDPVTELDKRIERMLKARITEEHDANFIGEEYGLEDNGAKYTLIIDPIDGTKSFITREFLSSVSVGIERQGELVGGFVYDFMRRIMYVCQDGKNKTYHKEELVPQKRSLGLSKIRLTFDGADIPEVEWPKNISTVEKNGSIALNMAQLAAGSYDGMLTCTRGRGNVWDVAAGYAMLRAAGFEMTDIDGNEFDYHNPGNGIIALHPNIADEVRKYLPE